MINAIGGDAEATDDGCIIHGRPRLTGGAIVHKGDHRIMMSAVVASIVCDGPVTMDDVECCAVSYPGFPEAMAALGMEEEVLRCTRPGRDSDSRCSALATDPSWEASSKGSRQDSRSLSLLHTSEPTRPLYSSYAVLCLKKKIESGIDCYIY